MERVEANKLKKQEEGSNAQKMSYEQLQQVAHQLSEQTRQLYEQLQKANLTNMFKRLDYLFKVVENAHMFSEDFVKQCTEEIVDTITLPDPKDTEQSEESTEEVTE